MTDILTDGEAVIAKGEFSSNDVHKQYGICLRTPPYSDMSIQEPVLCSMYLYRPKNKAKSDPVDFTFYPPNATRSSSAADNMFAAPQQTVAQKTATKRTRQKPQSQPGNDDPSSGQVNVPPKNSMVANSPGFRGAGGSVTIVQQQQQQQQQLGGYGQRQQGIGRSNNYCNIFSVLALSIFEWILQQTYEFKFF